MAAGVQEEFQQLTLNSETSSAAVDDLDCRTFFRSYKENGKFFSECLIEKCPKKRLCGKQKFNLERHLTTIHKMKFANIAPVLCKNEVTLKIQMSPAMLFRAYVQNLTLNGRPLASINDSGMRLLVDPMLKAFDDAKVHVDLSIPNVKRYLTKYSEAVKAEIRKETENSIIHVKLDLARRQRKSILGINVQFMKDDEIVVRTLSMMQTDSSHTGEYICALLLQTLDEYNITYSQVHSITTDNGKNVVRTVELFGEVENADLFATDDFDFENFFNEERAQASNSYYNLNGEDAEEDDNAEEQNDEEEANLYSAIRLFETKTHILSGLRCAAHTVQLVVNVALKGTNYSKKLISKCRRIVRSLLTPNMMNLIRQQNLRYPKIDCLTRWSSTYYMLERLVELKEFYVSMISFMPAGCNMNDSDWHNLDGILQILRLFESVTKKLQAVNFTVADFYCSWEELKIELETFSGVELVDNIMVQIAIRESDMIRNDIVYSCVFMDPRYRILLSEGIYYYFRYS